MLKSEFDYYLEHQSELVKDYNGKYIVIKNQTVIGSYDSEIEAFQESQKTEEVGSFLIQLCTPGEGSYTQTFHSRVVFA